jgi:hypothetical protein
VWRWYTHFVAADAAEVVVGTQQVVVQWVVIAASLVEAHKGELFTQSSREAGKVSKSSQVVSVLYYIGIDIAIRKGSGQRERYLTWARFFGIHFCSFGCVCCH